MNEYEEMAELMGPVLAQYEADVNGAPEISNLRFDPPGVDCGETATFSFDYRDPDADIAYVYKQVFSSYYLYPDWEEIEPVVEPAEAIGATGFEGTYAVEVKLECDSETEKEGPDLWYRYWLVDSEGSESNRAQAVLEWKEPGE